MIRAIRRWTVRILTGALAFGLVWVAVFVDVVLLRVVAFLVWSVIIVALAAIAGAAIREKNPIRTVDEARQARLDAANEKFRQDLTDIVNELYVSSKKR